MERRIVKISARMEFGIAAFLMLMSSFSLNAQESEHRKFYGSSGIYFTFMDKNETSVQLNENIGLKINNFALYVPVSLEERMYNLSTTKNFDLQGLLGLGLSGSFTIFDEGKMEMAFSGQSTVTHSDFRYALFRGEAKFLSPHVVGNSFIGVGAQYYKNYKTSIGKDALTPFVSFGFCF